MLIDVRLQCVRDTIKASFQAHTRVVFPGASTGRCGGGVRVVNYIPAERIDQLGFEFFSPTNNAVKCADYFLQILQYHFGTM